jgi:hypothetical protein
LQKQLRVLKQQLQQQRIQRERLEKKHATLRDKEQKQLEYSTHKLHQTLDLLTLSSNGSGSHNNKTVKSNYYHKALSRLGTKAQRTTSNSSSNATTTAASVVHTIATSPMTLAAYATSSSSSALTMQQFTPEEKEAMMLETNILRTMHYTMICQNQCDLVEASSKQVTSALKRERALLDTQQAEMTVIQMILDGTQRALQDLYPEIVLRQEILLERILQRYPRRQSLLDHNGSHDIPRLIVPSSLMMHPLLRSSTSSIVLMASDGISDLGDSIFRGSFAESMTDGSSIGDASFHNNPYHSSHGVHYYAAGPPVFTSVHALQQHTLQNMAGVESF